ncbi:fucolectin-5-like [Danio aesculapii]|uniref:fucolectin-5-like n=1 Tax=Danio aesculapii TaxID=1142201 RepID=UPI0024BF69E3|nr:fucolectin-5-like [Danio aesculapii]
MTFVWFESPRKVLGMQDMTTDQQDLALRGKAVQSSSFATPPKLAIDGHSTSCIHTKIETNPWWRLDLMNSFSIGRVVFTNRVDCCPELIDGAQILIGDSLENNGNNNSKCAEISGLSAGQSVSYSCGGLQGRYLNVFIPGDSKNLTLCELTVYSTGASDT